jgi:hypothetical protein
MTSQPSFDESRWPDVTPCFTLPGELWVDIPDSHSRVSNLGRFHNTKTHTHHHPKLTILGHVVVWIPQNPPLKDFIDFTDCVVARAFHPMNNDNIEYEHVNGDPFDCRAGNLSPLAFSAVPAERQVARRVVALINVDNMHEKSYLGKLFIRLHARPETVGDP